MKLCGIIAEFNPLTNGHKYLIEEAKRLTNLNVACIMSGNIVQRGSLAILEKYVRATNAINAGASIVIELPTIYAISSAQLFAEGAIKCLNNLNSISHLAFGVTINNPSNLELIARLKVKESQNIKNKIKFYIKNGNNYNVSLYNAYKEEYPQLSSIIDEVFSSSNNILALEYLTAIYKLNANIKPIYIKRTDNGYNSLTPKKTKVGLKFKYFAGATYIREQIFKNKRKKIKKYIPSYTYESLSKITKEALEKRQERFDAIVLSTLRDKTSNDLLIYNDYNEGLSKLVVKNANLYSTMSNIISEISSKSHRKNRISRLLLIPYLSITKEIFTKLNNSTLPLNVLTIKKEDKKILTQLIKQAKTKIIVSKKDYDNLSDIEKVSLIINQKASNLYQIASGMPYKKDLTLFI